MITDPWFWVLAVPAVTALGLSKGGFAGIGMISTPLLALVISPLQGAAILLPILLLQDVFSMWIYRHDWDAWNLKVMLPGAVVGVGAAWLFAAYVSDAYIELTVGIIGLVFVFYSWLRRPPLEYKKPSAGSGVFWGGLAGFCSTIIQVGAPPYQIHVLPQRMEKLTLVGTTVMFFGLVNTMKVVPYFALGQFSTHGLATSVVLFPLAIATNFLGVWLVRRTPTELFYRISYFLVFFISIILIWQGTNLILK